MLRQRILTVALLLPPVLAALFLLPNLYWSLLMVALLAGAGFEWARLSGVRGTGAWAYAGMLTALALAILSAEHLAQTPRAFIHSSAGRFTYVACATFWLAIAPSWLISHWEVRKPAPLLCVGVVVLVPFWHAVSWLQIDPAKLLLAASVIWISDTAAYFSGRALGRHKLAPRISPGKTVEGALGALIAVGFAWVAAHAWIPAYAGSFLSGLILVAVLTVIGIEGDLFESWLKRVAGLKDSGQILPGHGGLLDRIDALTSTLPLAALYFAYPALRL